MIFRNNKNEEILSLFHHIHCEKGKYKVHHCGEKHKGFDYKIKHCKCGLHNIDKKQGIGHDFNNKLIKVKFTEKCASCGWHIESGKIVK
ncbi:hypothetical protein ACFL0A_01430 [Patescibacteria group bacterium]